MKETLVYKNKQRRWWKKRRKMAAEVAEVDHMSLIRFINVAGM